MRWFNLNSEASNSPTSVFGVFKCSYCVGDGLGKYRKTVLMVRKSRILNMCILKTIHMWFSFRNNNLNLNGRCTYSYFSFYSIFAGKAVGSRSEKSFSDVCFHFWPYSATYKEVDFKICDGWILVRLDDPAVCLSVYNNNDTAEKHYHYTDD